MQTWTTSDTATAYSLDAAVIIGDELLISIMSMLVVGTVYVKDVAFCTDGERLWPGIYNTAYLVGVA